MTEEQAYWQGFEAKCAQYGVGPGALVKEAQVLQGAGNLLRGAGNRLGAGLQSGNLAGRIGASTAWQAAGDVGAYAGGLFTGGHQAGRQAIRDERQYRDSRIQARRQRGDEQLATGRQQIGEGGRQIREGIGIPELPAGAQTGFKGSWQPRVPRVPRVPTRIPWQLRAIQAERAAAGVGDTDPYGIARGMPHINEAMNRPGPTRFNTPPYREEAALYDAIAHSRPPHLRPGAAALGGSGSRN